MYPGYWLWYCRWTSTIVALPIVMYTSWILYERGMFFIFIFQIPRLYMMLQHNLRVHLVYGEKTPKKLVNSSSWFWTWLGDGECVLHSIAVWYWALKRGSYWQIISFCILETVFWTISLQNRRIASMFSSSVWCPFAYYGLTLVRHRENRSTPGSTSLDFREENENTTRKLCLPT